ncbi:ATP-binding response regulator [Fodinibius salsisoli]|uniref:histidine kinase n=1 Tax=Fodinibius salsisoli TaxID=2820877 RepID=A0ABT3PJP1_9BACT|nr:hybrid sensor histidine kinase/response regulator [Fodinibius salsisoli]MCW9705399.1 response regulator [Fodinibius salsisoli]
MDAQLKLLFINTPQNYLSSILRVFGERDIDIDYISLQDEKKIQDALKESVYWDTIILSGQESPPLYKLLNRISIKHEYTPLIFLPENYNSSIAAIAMQNGADDCISINGLERLIPIIERELKHHNLKNKHLDLFKFKHILSNLTDKSQEEVFLFDGETFKCLYTSLAPIGKGEKYSEKKILALKPGDIYSEYSTESFRLLITPLLEGQRKELSICTFVTTRLGTVYPAEIHLRKVVQHESSYIIAINKDISSLWFKVQKLQRQRSLTKKHTLQSKRKDIFLANAAHDMRTSINSIILSAKLLNQKNNDQLTDSCKKLTNAILYSGKHLMKYIEEFFNSTDKQIANLKFNTTTVSIDTLGKELYYIFDPIATKQGLTFTYQVQQLDQYTIPTNPTYLKIILKNLLSNAFKYTPKGDVSLTIYSPSNEELQNINTGLDQAIAFQVKDTGVGIPQSKLNHIFERFTRIKQNRSCNISGSGLGLDISQKLTKVLGGILHIDSELNIGSTITLYLPSDSEPKIHQSNRQDSTILSKSTKDNADGKTILVIDDSKIHNLAIKEFLGYSFANCLTTSSIANAYKILSQQSIDCIILDYILFDTTSEKILQNLKSHKKYANIPIIIYTGKKITDKKEEKISSKVDAIIQKRTGSHSKLLSTIKACLHSKPPINLTT